MVPVRKYDQNWLPNWFDDFFDNEWMRKANATAPAINVLVDEQQYEVEVAAPGMTKDDFKIHVDADNNLVIEMEKQQTNTNEGDEKAAIIRQTGFQTASARYDTASARRSGTWWKWLPLLSAKAV